jgi:hypothetical protein
MQAINWAKMSGGAATIAGWDGEGECEALKSSSLHAEIERFGVDGEFGLHLAVTDEQRLTCWNLVYQEYLAKGYTQPQSLPLRYSLHDALPDTGTFLIERLGEPVGTVSVFPDSPLGLPADDIYRAEIDGLRDAGRIPVEIGRLTIVPKFAKDRKVLMKMVEIPCLYARHVLKATDIVITVNPAHESFYGRMMLFETLGQGKTLGSVCGAPAVLMRMDLAYQEQLIQHARGEGPCPDGDAVRHTVYRSFRGRSGERDAAERIWLVQQPLSAGFLRKYFVHERPLVQALHSPLKYFLSKCYPDYDMR